jgi:hypothetical protein
MLNLHAQRTQRIRGNRSLPDETGEFADEVIQLVRALPATNEVGGAFLKQRFLKCQM